MLDRLDQLTCPKALVRFTEPTAGPCEPLGHGMRGERIFDWLDEQVPA